MKNVMLIGVTLEELLLQFEQIIDTKIGALPHQTEKQTDYISRNEVARLLNISLPTLHDWTEQGWLQWLPHTYL